MIVGSGIVIFLGLLVLFAKLPRRWALRLLAYPLALDLAASAIAYGLHWGTFTGVMAAAVAALMCSAFTLVARRLFGWIDSRGQHPGIFFVRT